MRSIYLKAKGGNFGGSPPAIRMADRGRSGTAADNGTRKWRFQVADIKIPIEAPTPPAEAHILKKAVIILTASILCGGIGMAAVLAFFIYRFPKYDWSKKPIPECSPGLFTNQPCGPDD